MKKNLYLIIAISAIAALLMFAVMGIYRLVNSGNEHVIDLKNTVYSENETCFPGEI